VVGLLFVWFVVLGPACWEPACKNPKRGPPNGEAGAREGVLVQCNVVLICAQQGADFEKRLTALEDAQIIDRGSSDANEDACTARAKARGVSGICHKIEVNPNVICLDPPGSEGCNAGAGDSTVIIVGSAASGDYRGEFKGAGGTEGHGSGDGADGQGGD